MKAPTGAPRPRPKDVRTLESARTLLRDLTPDDPDARLATSDAILTFLEALQGFDHMAYPPGFHRRMEVVLAKLSIEDGTGILLARQEFEGLYRELGEYWEE